VPFDDSLPPFKSLNAALRRTTEALARELACPSVATPDWNDFEWRIAQAVAAMQGVSSLLADRLRWLGPQSWRRFLDEQKQQTIGRQRLIAQLLAGIAAGARREGIAIVALKGAALHAIGVYGPGERPMGDIDLLVRAGDVAATARLIEVLGWHEAFGNRRHRVFEARDKSGSGETRFGEHTANPIKIEVHTRIAESLPAFEIDITEWCFPVGAHAGLDGYPSIAALMAHLLLHAAGNMRARALRLIQLHDIALLAARMDSTSWEELLVDEKGDRNLWWALPPLLLTARYYPDTIPRSIISAIAPDCPWWLRQVAGRHRLADVSWSKLRIQAFPGIEWARSPREAARFAMSRIHPSREALDDLARGVAGQQWASVVPWYGLSHPARIIRWIFSRPPRVQTMFSVRSALQRES